MATGSQNMTTYLAKGISSILTANAENTDNLLYINTDDANITADILGETTSLAFTRTSITGAYTTGHIVWLNAANIGTPFQLVVHDSSDLYLYKRWKSSGAWTAWSKMSAGHADDATKITSTPNNTTTFLRGDNTWTNTLGGAFTANGTITASGGYLKSTANENTVQIGSQNSSYCHIYNSKNIPFAFSHGILCVNQGDLGTTGYPFHQLVLGGTTNATMTAASSNPRITFQENTGTQPVHILYCDWDSYRAPAGLKIIGGTDASPAWFEAEGNIYSGGHFTGALTASSWLDGQRYMNAAYNIADYSNTSAYNPWMRATNTWSSGADTAKVGRWFSFGTLGTSFYWIGSTTTRTSDSYEYGMTYNISNGVLTATRMDCSWLHIVNNSSNNSDDALVYLESKTTSDWAVKINKGGNRYGVYIDSLDQDDALKTNGYVRARCVWANQGSNGERQVGVDSSTSGSLYFYAHTTGKGIYSGSGYKTGTIIGITNNTTTFYGTAVEAMRIEGNLGAVSSNTNCNIWVSSTSSADGIPKYISGLYVNASTCTLYASYFRPSAVSGYSNTYLGPGTGDGNGNGTANIVLRSWHGVGFMNGCPSVGTNGAVTAGVDCRTGYMYAYSFQNRSSRLVKEHIYSLPLEKAKRILLSRPVGFDFKPEFGGMKNQYGLIAEELETIIPELVTVPTSIGGYKTIDYVKIVPFLIRVIQEHEREIEELRLRVAQLELKK